MRRFIYQLVTVAITCAASLLAAAAATAQGADHYFAKPMSWATLRDRIEQLSPAEAQWADMQASHDDYLLEMDAFRRGAVKRWLNDHGTGLMSMIMTDPSAAMAARRELASLQQRLGSIDDDFFAQAAMVLGDDQQLPMERLRLRRARDRMLSSRDGLEVRLELVDHIAPELLDDSVQGALYDWEDRRTGLLKAYVAAQLRRDNTLGEVLTAYSGNAEAAAQDPELSGSIQQAVQAEIAKAQKPLRASRDALSAHAWQGARTVADMLPLKDAHRLRMRVLPSFQLHVSEDFRRNLHEMGIAQDHPAVKAILEDYWDDMAGLTTPAVLAAAALPEPGEMVFFTFGDDASDPWTERLEGLRKAQAPLQARSNEVNRALGELGGADTSLSREVHAHLHQPPHMTGSSVVMIASSGAEGMDLPDGAVVMSSSMHFDGDEAGFFGTSSMFGFQPMPSTLRARLIRDMALDSDGIATLNLLLKDHASTLQEAGDAATADTVSNDGSRIMLTQFSMNDDGRQITESADAAFFDALELLPNGEAVHAHRQARQRVLHASGSGVMGMISMGFGDGGSMAFQADPSESLQRADIDPSIVTDTLNSLDDWQGSATTAAQRLGSARRAQNELINSQIQHQLTADTESASINFSTNDAQQMGDTQKRLQQAQQALGEAYRDGLQLILDGMSEMDALKVRRQWLLTAYPSVLGRGDPLARSFADAMELADLTETQRGGITMLHVEHNDAWWASSTDMIAAMGQSGPGLGALISGSDPEAGVAAFEAMQQSRQELDRKKFARREAALKRLAALRSMLSAEQLGQLNGLQDPKDRSRNAAFGF